MNEDWVIVKNFIDKNTADLLYGYVLLADKRLRVLNDVDPQIRELPNDEPTVYGRFGDEMQITNDYCQYGDLIFDALLLGKVKQLSDITKMDLLPQYSYYRLYKNGSELTRHKDRSESEIAITLCLGYKSEYTWPIFLKNKNGQVNSVKLEPGDMVTYKGCDLEHWREPFMGDNHAQVFLFYTSKNNENNKKYDCRPALGLQYRYRVE